MQVTRSSGKDGNIWQFNSCWGKCQGIVWGKSGQQKLLIANFTFGVTPVFSMPLWVMFF